MLDRRIAVAFDVDPASLVNLRKALPDWEIEVVNGATLASLSLGWTRGAADLLVLQAGAEVAETLELCRFLARCGAVSTGCRDEGPRTSGLRGSRPNQAPPAGAPLLVLVPHGREPLVRAVLEAGADSCLVLPVHAKEVASMLVRARQGNRPGRHTLDLDRAQCEDRWRDDGGQG
jgi:DNA-binding NarL/FixJ family response regulator